MICLNNFSWKKSNSIKSSICNLNTFFFKNNATKQGIAYINTDNIATIEAKILQTYKLKKGLCTYRLKNVLQNEIKVAF